MSNKHLRKRRFVDSQVQGALICRVIIHWSVFFVASMVAITTISLLFTTSNESLFSRLAAVWSDHSLFLLILVALMPAFIMDTIKLSNRFAGPMVRLRRQMKELAGGDDVKPLKFRDGDFWNDLASELNTIAAELSELRAERARNPMDPSAQSVVNDDRHDSELVNA